MNARIKQPFPIVIYNVGMAGLNHVWRCQMKNEFHFEAITKSPSIKIIPFKYTFPLDPSFP